MQDSRPKTSSEQRLFQLYHDVVEMRGEMVCTFDADTRLLQVNDAYAKAFGKTREQLLGQPFIDLIPPSEHENIFRHLAQLQAKKHEVMYEHQVIDGYGNTNWQEWCDRAIFNDDGSLSHFISVGRSINQRKQLEKELKQKHAAESLIARVAKNLVNAELNNLNSSIDEALGEIGAYTNAGRVYVHQYDFERQVLSNTHEWCAEGIEASKPQLQDVPLDLVPEWLEAHKRGERVFIADTASQDVEKSLRIQLQRRGITSLLLLPLIKNGTCLGCLGVDLIEKNIHWSASSLTIMDVLAEVITNAIDRIHYEAKLISARDEALQATKEKSSFIATMSHEIRNPLNGVLGMIEMLQKTPLSNEQQHMIQALSSSGTMLLDIVNQASELQKIEQQTRTLRYSDIVVEDLIHEVKLIFEERLSQKKLFFKVENQTEAIGGRLRGAYLPLKQVLVNLTGNAIKFTEEGGITIRVDVQKSSSNQPAMLRFNVMDTGPGIAAKDAEEAFNPYVQLHTASDASIRKEGYGLGLSISKQLVEEMGGEIGAETDEETTAGACFWFSIPEAPPVVSQSAKTPAAGPIPERPAESEPAPASPGLLLAAKPDASIHVLRRQLEVLAFDYVFCTSLHETKVHFDAPDAAYKHLIIDLNLGTKAVLNAISSLKNKPRWWNLNIILLGYNEKDFSSDWKQSYDIREFLVKPLSNEQVAQLLDSGPAVPVAPLTSASATQRAEKVPEEAVYPQLSVLVAEDNQVNQMLIKFILEKLRLKHFDIVPNGARAVEALKYDDYDLVLMDC
ncbi:MAG: ATP-binding protein, partial [Cyclonatronaceae bacterium]